jgi:DNA-binding MarR family transcriptional regulator
MSSPTWFSMPDWCLFYKHCNRANRYVNASWRGCPRHSCKGCYTAVVTDDVTTQSLWRSLRELMERVDNEVARVYESSPDTVGVRPSWVLEILRLDARGPMTISQLSASVGRTHSASSQKVAAMAKAGLVETTQGSDARTRRVQLTDPARKLVPRMRAEWAATEEALSELEAETPYALSRAVADLNAALDRKSFHERLSDRLAATDHSGS